MSYDLETGILNAKSGIETAISDLESGGDVDEVVDTLREALDDLGKAEGYFDEAKSEAEDIQNAVRTLLETLG